MSDEEQNGGPADPWRGSRGRFRPGNPGAFRPGNDKGCQFQPGNTVAMTHGAYLSIERPELRALVESELAAVIETLGGESEMTPQLRAVVESYARKRVTADAAFTAVLDGGLVTAKGRTRAIVKVWQALDEAMVKRAVLLGLERRVKRVTSFAAAVAQEPVHE